MRDTNPEDFYVPFVTIFGMQILLFFIALAIKDNSIVDMFWGIGIALPNLTVLLVNKNWHHRTIISLTWVWLWALRLLIYIWIRKEGEDWRYQNWRRQWYEKGGQFLLIFNSFFIVFMFQGLFMCFVGSSVLFTAIWSEKSNGLFVQDYLGAAIFLFGLAFETIADYQLYAFRNNPQMRGKILKTGLWRYTRHPNYFGEAVVWWGVYLISCSIKWGWVTFYSAALITILVRFVSGVPYLEEKYKDRRDFKIYKEETNWFVPWIVRNVDESQFELSDQENLSDKSDKLIEDSGKDDGNDGDKKVD